MTDAQVRTKVRNVFRCMPGKAVVPEADVDSLAQLDLIEGGHREIRRIV